MCYPVTCATCRKTGWGGCGRHVDAVMRSVPASDRCNCGENPTPAREERRTVRSFFRR
jgi:hypothetical protein